MHQGDPETILIAPGRSRDNSYCAREIQRQFLLRQGDRETILIVPGRSRDNSYYINKCIEVLITLIVFDEILNHAVSLLPLDVWLQ